MILAAIGVGTIDLMLGGFVVVADPNRQLATATLRDAAGDRPMRPIADGFWAARARVDGAVVLACANGAEIAGPYVSRGLRVRETVAPGACAAARARR